jgi:RimJ/RimL family protein N-acetyltransferase
MRDVKLTKAPRTTVRLYSDKYLVRTIKLDDASDRWAGWMSDPEIVQMLNLPAKTWTKTDVINYINEFDQRSRLLLGIFLKQAWLHIGIMAVDLRPASSQLRVNMLIGDPDYRNKGVANEITVPFRDYFFETLGLGTMRANVLARNHVIRHYLEKTGWMLDQTVPRHVKSSADGTLLDLSMYSLTRDAWRAWKTLNLTNKS